MTELQLELTKLLGEKDLSFGCIFSVEWDSQTYVFVQSWINETTAISAAFMIPVQIRNSFKKEIIGHEPTIADLLKWLNNSIKYHLWHLTCDGFEIEYQENWEWKKKYVDYDFSKSLLSQSEETLKAIINLINSHERN